MGATHWPSRPSLPYEWLLFDSLTEWTCEVVSFLPPSLPLSFFLAVEFIILVNIKRLGDFVEISSFSEKIVSDNISPTFALGS